MRPPLLALPPHALLYVMVKPPLAPRDACVACRKALGINPHYAANRFHCTMLPLGRWDAWPVERLAPLIAAFDALWHERREYRGRLARKSGEIRTLAMVPVNALAEFCNKRSESSG